MRDSPGDNKLITDNYSEPHTECNDCILSTDTWLERTINMDCSNIVWC